MANDKITLGAQAGCPKSYDVTSPVVLSLRKKLAAHCTASYSPVILEFAIILRINGSLDHFEGEGVQRLRINRKDAYVTADYVVPEERWNGVAVSEIKKYLAAAAVQTIQAMVRHLIKLKITVDAAKLTEDVERAVGDFLNEAPNS